MELLMLHGIVAWNMHGAAAAAAWSMHGVVVAAWSCCLEHACASVTTYA
jgi:hypothetical protein